MTHVRPGWKGYDFQQNTAYFGNNRWACMVKS